MRALTSLKTKPLGSSYRASHCLTCSACSGRGTRPAPRPGSSRGPETEHGAQSAACPVTDPAASSMPCNATFINASLIARGEIPSQSALTAVLCLALGLRPTSRGGPGDARMRPRLGRSHAPPKRPRRSNAGLATKPAWRFAAEPAGCAPSGVFALRRGFRLTGQRAGCGFHADPSLCTAIRSHETPSAKSGENSAALRQLAVGDGTSSRPRLPRIQRSRTEQFQGCTQTAHEV